MRQPLTVLLVEDSEDDALLIVAALQRCGWDVTWQRVDTPERMAAALDRSSFDLVVSDYRMPRFGAFEALALWRERGLDSPFLVVSGTIGEEQAVEILSAGARDFFLKDRLSRLCSSVTLALAETQRRRALRRAEQEREEALQRLRPLAEAIEQAAEGVLITDVEGRIEYVNPAIAVITGYSQEELLGRNPRVLKSGVHDASFYEVMWDTLRAGGVWQGDITNRRQDGSLSVERTTIAPVRDDAGTIGHFIALKHEVTERRKEEEALRRLQFAIEHTPDGFLWVGADGRILYANDAVSRRLGYSRDELLHLTIADVAPGFEGGAWPAHWQALSATGSAVYETRARAKDGASIPVEVAVSHVVFEGAEYHCSFIRDISDRKRAEAALRHSEERYRLLFERNLAGVYRSTLDGRILECNDAFTRMFGYGSPEEILSHSAVELYPSPQAREDLVARLRSEGAILNRESQGRKRDGGTIKFLENAHLVEGDILEGTVVDITEHRALEERFRQSQKLEAIGRLAGGVAHDFNNLLGVIQGYGELMRRQLPEAAPARGRLEQILKAADRAAALTHQLLAFSRKQVLRPRILHLNSVVSDMRKLLERLIGEDIALVTRLDPGLGNVMADGGQVEQVIMNLAVNARDAMADGGTLTIETSNAELDAAYAARHPPTRAGSYVLLAVSDTGQGMSAEVQTHLFEPFFTTKDQGKGTGLGLSTVYGIVKQSEGYIWVYSEVGTGATFKIYLPRIDAEVAATPEQAEAPPPRGNETVLLVEDNDALRELLHETLEDNGYVVLVARDGREALHAAAVHDGPIHLLVSDVIMPGASGRKLADELSATRPEMKVLYMSGYTDEAIIRHGVLASGVAFLSKPFSSEALLRKLAEVLGR